MEFLAGIIGLIIGGVAVLFMNKDKVDSSQIEEAKDQALNEAEKKFETRKQELISNLNAEHKQELESTKNLYEEQINSLDSSETEITSLKGKISELQARVDELEGYETQLNNLQAQITDSESTDNQINELQKRISELEVYETQVNELQKRISELEEYHQIQIDELNSSHQAQLEGSIESVKQEYESEIKQLKKLVNSPTNQLSPESEITSSSENEIEEFDSVPDNSDSSDQFNLEEIESFPEVLEEEAIDSFEDDTVSNDSGSVLVSDMTEIHDQEDRTKLELNEITFDPSQTIVEQREAFDNYKLEVPDDNIDLDSFFDDSSEDDNQLQNNPFEENLELSSDEDIDLDSFFDDSPEDDNQLQNNPFEEKAELSSNDDDFDFDSFFDDSTADDNQSNPNDENDELDLDSLLEDSTQKEKETGN